MPSPENTDGASVSRPSPIQRDWFLIQLAALVFLLDQFSKFLVRELLPFRASFPEGGFFRITHQFNSGSAFGLFQNHNLALILVSIIGIVVLIRIYQGQSRPSNLLRMSIGLQLGGAFGNLVDRLHPLLTWVQSGAAGNPLGLLRQGYVTDFIDIGPWPTFNLADSSIVIGILLLVWLFLGPKRASREGLAGRTTLSLGDLGYWDGHRDGYSWCPICDGEMEGLDGGWRCSTCGVRETIDGGPNAPSSSAGRQD